MQRSQKARIAKIKEAPISWKERDLLTAAEKYMKGAIGFPMVEYASGCFPKIEKNTLQKIEQVWACSSAAYHLQQLAEKGNNSVKTDFPNSLQLKAARIYEQEAQRILGSIFPIEHKFWEPFYVRQQEEMTKPLVPIDALHFSSGCQQQIAYQLLIQSFKVILEGHYTTTVTKRNHFENAKRLLVDLPMSPLQAWLNQQLV